MKYILQMYIFIFSPDLMYRGHIVKASLVSRKKVGRIQFLWHKSLLKEKDSRLSSVEDHMITLSCKLQDQASDKYAFLSEHSEGLCKKAACVLHPKAEAASLVILQKGQLKAEVKKLFSFSQNCITSY